MKLDEPRPAPAGFAHLAMRISAWTTRALLTGVILVAALAVGRQTTEWWRAEPPPGPAAGRASMPAEGVGDAQRPHLLQLGNSAWAMLRQSLAGSADQVGQELQQRCRVLTAASRVPPTPVERTEKALLATLGQIAPTDESPGEWAVYRIPAGFPVFVGVRPEVSAARSSRQHVAVSACRVVTWAVAAPVAKDQWSLYVFYPEKGAESSTSSPTRVPVAPGTSPTLGIRVLGGGAVLGFQGPQAASAVMLFYDQWFSQLGWSSSGWQTAGGAWHVVYRSKLPVGPTAEIRISAAPGGATTGLAVTSGDESP